MNKSILMGTLAALVGVASIGFGYYAGRAGMQSAMKEIEPAVVQAPVQPVDNVAIETIVRNYLMKNPEILSEVQSALETKRDNDTQAAQTAYLSNAGPDLFDNANDAIIGNAQGDVTVVEFFDYNCGYCRRALGDMDKLVGSDPNVRFVLKELPILGPDSVKAHIVAQAFRIIMPEKYGDFHRALLNAGHADEASAISVATSLGADEGKLRVAMGSPEIGKVFDQNNQIAQALNVTGTPSYVIKDTIVPGAMGFDVLSQNVANVRKCQSATC